MTKLPERLPAPLSERIAGASGAIYSAMGREVDVAIGGIPFRLATSGETPQTVETIALRKDQFDVEIDPGEQSLTGWWRRSQASFHQGAGFLYEPNNNQEHNGFWDSEGVRITTPGRFELLHKMKELAPAATIFSRMRTYAVGGTRVNLCTNPSAETTITGWSGGGSLPPTVTRSTARAFVGTACIKGVWQTGGSLPLVDFNMPALTSGRTYTVSCHVWVPTGSPGVSVVVNGLPGFDGFGEGTDLKDQWVRLEHDFVADAGHSFQVWPGTPPTAGQEVYIDAVLFEEGSVVGPYFDGTSVNSAWTGTAHASSSIETTPASAASLSAIGDGKLYKNTTDGTISSDLVALHDPAPTIVDGLIAGTSFYDVASDGTLYQGLVSSPGTATTWPCGTTPSRLGWGKHRLWMIGGRKLWQPDLSLVGGSAQNPIFTHPNQGWTYTCMAEGPSAMYFGGHDGFSSSIQAVTLDSGGGLPTLSGATVTAVLPDGELVQELAVVAGQFVGIGTTAGFRVGVVNSDASITYGPLIVEPEGVSLCTAMTSQGNSFLVSFRTTSGKALAYRIDTATEISDGVFAYSKDADCGFIGHFTSLASIGDRVCGTTQDGRAWYQSDSELVSSGYLQTSRIRFRTTEPKSFKYVDLDIEPLDGNISVDLILEGDSTFPLGNITQQGEVAADPLSIDTAAMRYGSLKLTLTPDADNVSPVVTAYLLRALPAAKPQRLITLPLLCFDREKAKSGQLYGADGYALDRLVALQLLEDQATTLTYQDFSLPGAPARIVAIESLRFVQASPPGREGPGGILVAQLRTVD